MAWPCKRIVFALALYAVSGTCNIQAAPGARTFSDTVSLPPRTDGLHWKIINTGAVPGERIAEMVPDGQSADAWSQIITVKVLRGKDPLTLVNGTVDLLRTVCGKLNVVRVAHHQSVGETAGTGRELIPLPVIETDEVLLTCRDPDATKLPGNHSIALLPIEVTWYKIMRCDNLGYVVQRSWHGRDASDSILSSPAVLAAWKRWITAVTIRRDIQQSGAAAPPLATSPI